MQEMNEIIENAVNHVINEYLANGGKVEEMRSQENIEFFFLGLYAREGEEGIKAFLKDWKPNPKKKI
ncbi:MAG: hypothetical protein ACI4M0_00575 [Christensenellales bacterium]